MHSVLTLILGGGRGNRLFPLTWTRSKPAVPIGGKYRLIDVPVSNCLHANLRRIFVLTQFNSASLNRHVAQSYRLDISPRGSSTSSPPSRPPTAPRGSRARPTRCARRRATSLDYDADHFLILAGDHLYRMDFCDLIDAHIEQDADITIAAQPCDPRDVDADGHLPVRRRGQHHRLRGEAQPGAARRDRQQRPAGAGSAA